jgi:hypothetical protein
MERPSKKVICGVMHVLTRCNQCHGLAYTKAGQGRVVSRYVCKTCQELPGDCENKPDRVCRLVGEEMRALGGERIRLDSAHERG